MASGTPPQLRGDPTLHPLLLSHQLSSSLPLLFSTSFSSSLHSLLFASALYFDPALPLLPPHSQGAPPRLQPFLQCPRCPAEGRVGPSQP